MRRSSEFFARTGCCADPVRPYADHFSRLAPAYAACRPGYPEELFTYLAGLAPSRELAWDCAAGSGQATIPLARRFRRVVATDISAAMLHQAPLRPNIEYRVAPAERSGLPEAAADLVTVAQALHWLPLPQFFDEAARDGHKRGWTGSLDKLEKLFA